MNPKFEILLKASRDMFNIKSYSSYSMALGEFSKAVSALDKVVLKDEWRWYNRVHSQQARPYIPGELLEDIEFEDKTPQLGGMIIIDQDDNMWYETESEFKNNLSRD